MISAQELRYSYGLQSSFSFPEVSCEGAGTLLIIGPSGSGKTTLLHLLGGILKPLKGTVIINGTEVSSLSGTSLDRFRGKNLGLVHQKHHFVASLSVKENIMLPSYLTKQKVDAVWFGQLADELNIESQMEKKPRELSEGEKQRVAMMRAMILKPKVLLADEPSSSLDDANCNKVVDILKQLTSLSGSALIIVTHDQRLKDVFENRIELSN